MIIVIRTDASLTLGVGHLMRCLALADELKKTGCKLFFICCDLPESLFFLIEQRGYVLFNRVTHSKEGGNGWEKDAVESIACIHALSGQVDWLIVDHYGLDCQWESLLGKNVKKIMVIDDLANRTHDCDVLLDQNFYCNYLSRYDHLLGSHCKKLLGPQYALLRPEFQKVHSQMGKRKGEVKRILVFFGGSDSYNLTAKAIEAIQRLNRPDIMTDIVVGASNPHRLSIKQRCDNLSHMSFHMQVDNMAELMGLADFALAAGGSSMWERCFLGLPSITVIFAGNQEQTTVDVAREGAIMNLGWSSQLKISDYVEAMQELISQPDKLHEMSDKALRLMGENSYRGTEVVAATLL